MSRKSSTSHSARLAGLDLCDSLVADLCARGLLTVTPEVLDRLGEYERSLQSYKLMRFSRELAALQLRFREGLRHGSVDAALLGDRLARLQQAAETLRRLLEDPLADPREIEDLAGRTWRDADLDRRERVLLAEMAWESVRLEEGFRVDTSYFLARGGEILCERKIVPLLIRAALDDSFKPQHPHPVYYPAVGIYPGDVPRRVKILVPAAPGTDRPAHAAVLEMLAGAPTGVKDLRRIFGARRRRPFPPDTLPVVLVRPRVCSRGGRWWIVGEDGDRLEVVPPTGMDRKPAGQSCFDAFEDTILSTPQEALLLLLQDTDGRITASPAGAITPERVIRFALNL